MAQALSGPYTPALVRRALEAFEDQRGWLAVSDGTRDLCWVCAREGVRVVLRGTTPPPPAQWLVLGGALTPEQEQRFAAARGAGLPDAQALQRAGVPASQLDAATRSLAAQLLIDALFWDEPCADGGAGEPPFAERLLARELEVMSVSVPLATLLADVRDRLVRASATLKALPSAAVSVVTTGEAGARQHLAGCHDPLERQVLERVLQRPGVHGDELVGALGCGEGQLLLRLLRLVEARVVQVERLPADQAARRAALAQPIASPDEVPRRLWLAGVAEGLEEGAQAAHQLTSAGWLLMAQGRHTEAAELFAQALRHAPEDARSLQGRVSAAWALGREEEAAQLSEVLANHYLRLGLPGQAQQTVSRALEARESGQLLDLSVLALIELGEQRAAERLTESLVLQLRKEGRAREAERAVQRLEALRPPERSERAQLRAQPRGTGGGVKAVAVVGLLCAPVLGMALLHQRRELSGRQAFARAVEGAAQAAQSLRAGEQLEAADWRQVAASFAVPPGASDELRQAFDQARAEAEQLGRDAQQAGRARDVLKYTWSTNLTLAHSQLRAIQAESPALGDPLDGVLRRAETILDRAKKGRLRVSSFPRTGELGPGFEEGKRLLREFPNVPGELEQAQVWIEIQSDPPGAFVTWRGQATRQRTPLRIDIPVLGQRELKLELSGHRPFETTLEMATLDSPTPVFRLEPEGGPR